MKRKIGTITLALLAWSACDGRKSDGDVYLSLPQTLSSSQENKSSQAAPAASLTEPLSSQSLTVSGRPRSDRPFTGRLLNPGDPNLDPAWDWTASPSGHTMYYSTSGATPTQLTNVQVPFYSSGHPLNTTDKDMYKEDGWMLVYRDFGTPTDAPPMPFFVLYNKYRGILRVMFYNAPSVAYSDYRVDLSFREASHSGALLTFTDSQHATLADYDKNKTENFMARVATFRGWAYADFTVAGYDPALDPEAKLRLTIWGIDESAIKLNSTKFTLNEVMDKANPSASKSSGTDLISAFNQGQKFYNDVNSLTNSLNDQVKREDAAKRNPWWKSIVKGLVGASFSGGGSIVAGLVGFVTSFIGGETKAAPREPLNFQGALELSGTITVTREIVSADFALSPTASGTDAYRPVQTIPWGVYNLKKKPVVRLEDYEGDLGDRPDLYCRTMDYVLEDLSYIINPNTGMTLESVETAFALKEDAPTKFASPSSLMLDVFWFPWCDIDPGTGLPGVCFCGGYFPKVEQVAVKLTFKINSPTKYSDQKIILYRLYPYDKSTAGLSW